MLKRSFTKRETALILVLAIALLGLLYYQFVYKWVERSKASFDTSAIEDEIMVQQTKAARIRQMQEEIEEGIEQSVGTVETYNNLKQEINQLNDIFADATDFDFGFDQAEAEGDAVRRNIRASFTATSYAQAKDMLADLYDCEYRCLIRDISVSPTSLGSYNNAEQNLNRGPVRVSFTVVFYETLFGSDTTDGLLITNSESDEGDESLLSTLAQSKTAAENQGL